MNLVEKTLNEEYIYKGRIINLRKDTAELPDGSTAYREVIEHPGGVCVAPITEKGEIVLVRQFRYPYKKLMLEIPAGKKERGEEPLLCGIRELYEETGAKCENLEPLGIMYPTPGYTDETIYIYTAKNITVGQTHLDDDEFLQTVVIPFDEALKMVLSGEICDAKTQIAILKLAVSNRTE